MERIQKEIGFRFKQIAKSPEDSNAFLIRGLFTDDQIDKHGDIITREATIKALDTYKEWGNIRYMHQPRPVAVVVRAGEADGLGWNEVEVDVKKEDVRQDIRDGLLRGFSVGISVDWENVEYNEQTDGFIIHDYLLGEISLVDHPANYAAKLASYPKALLKEAALSSESRLVSSLVNYLEEQKMQKQKEVIPVVEEEVIVLIEEEKEIIEEKQSPEIQEEIVEEVNEEVSAEEEKDIVEDESEPEGEEVQEPAEEEEADKDIQEESEEESAELSVDKLAEVVVALEALVKSLGEISEKFVSIIETKFSVEEAEAQEDITEQSPVEEEQEEQKDVLATEDFVKEVGDYVVAQLKGIAPERKGVLPSEEVQNQQEEQKEIGIRDHLKKYLATRQ